MSQCGARLSSTASSTSPANAVGARSKSLSSLTDTRKQPPAKASRGPLAPDGEDPLKRAAVLRVVVGLPSHALLDDIPVLLDEAVQDVLRTRSQGGVGRGEAAPLTTHRHATRQGNGGSAERLPGNVSNVTKSLTVRLAQICAEDGQLPRRSTIGHTALRRAQDKNDASRASSWSWLDPIHQRRGPERHAAVHATTAHLIVRSLARGRPAEPQALQGAGQERRHGPRSCSTRQPRDWSVEECSQLSEEKCDRRERNKQMIFEGYVGSMPPKLLTSTGSARS